MPEAPARNGSGSSKRVAAPACPALMVLLFGGSISAGCGEAPYLPADREQTSAHFEYATRIESQICDGTLSSLENHFAALQAQLGFSWPAGRRVRYYRYTDGADYRENAPCLDLQQACTQVVTGQPPVVHTTAPVQRHELIHAYLAHIGRPSRIYIEGVAEAFGCSSTEETRQPGPTWREALFPEDLETSARWYFDAGRFVRFLLDKFGSASFLTIYASGKADLNEDAFAQEFKGHFGESLDTLWPEVVAAIYPGNNHKRCLCLGPEVVPNGPQARLDSCGADRDFDKEMVLRLERPQMLVLESRGATTAGNQLRACPGTPPPPSLPAAALPRRLGLSFASEVVAGRYFIGGIDAIRVKATDIVNKPQCSASLSYEVPADGWVSNVFIAPHDGATTLKLKLSEEQTFVAASPNALVCPTCGDMTGEQAACGPAAATWMRDEKLRGEIILGAPAKESALFRFNEALCLPDCSQDGGSRCAPYCVPP